MEFPRPEPLGHERDDGRRWLQFYQRLAPNEHHDSSTNQAFCKESLKRRDDLGESAVACGERRLRQREDEALTKFGRDENIVRAQVSLKMAGYDLGNTGSKQDGVDGEMTPLTIEAVKTFQTSVGLKPSGVLDKDTLLMLDFVTENGLTKQEIEAIGRRAAGHGLSASELATHNLANENRRANRDELVSRAQVKSPRGDSDLMRAQASLALAGYDLGDYGVNGVDGWMGDKTQASLQHFQKTHGLQATGGLNPESIKALNQATESGWTLGRSQVELRNQLFREAEGKGEALVAFAQSCLAAAGYDLGRSGVDGKHGPMTAKAVMAFQRSKGLDPTGRLDQQTLWALEKATEAGWQREKSAPETKRGVRPKETVHTPREKTYDLEYSFIKAVQRPESLRGKTILVDSVKDAQIKLKEIGFDIGPHGVDGDLGKDTNKAIVNFQRTFGLHETGALDKTTIERLELEYRKGAVVTKRAVETKVVNDARGHESISNTNGRIYVDLRSTDRGLPVKASITNNVGERSPEAYNSVIQQFDVENNPRYKAGNGKTWCNIFAWDVTSAMGAEIPHWVNEKGEPSYRGAKGAYEMNANLTAKWLKEHGEAYGWEEVTAKEAQEAAERGEVAVAIWYNNSKVIKDANGSRKTIFDDKNHWTHDWGASGHIAIVRPKDPGSTIKSLDGVYIAQAGSSNFSYHIVEKGFTDNKRSQSTKPQDYYKYYVHK